MTYGLAKSCEVKSELFKEYKTSKSDEAKNTFITYRNKLQKLLKKAEKDYYTKKLADCHGDQKRSWKIINSLLNKDSQKISPNYEFKCGNESITNCKLIAENLITTL